MIRIHSLTARLATLFAVLAASLLVLAAMLFGRMLDMHFQELDMHELQGKVTLDYRPEGLVWQVEAPAENLLERLDGEKH